MGERCYVRAATRGGRGVWTVVARRRDRLRAAGGQMRARAQNPTA